MHDRRAQYIITVGDLCVAASLAKLEIEVVTNRGDEHSGEADDSGYERMFRIDSSVINLEEIVECTILAPSGT
jgi:hypothetical protein